MYIIGYNKNTVFSLTLITFILWLNIFYMVEFNICEHAQVIDSKYSLNHHTELIFCFYLIKPITLYLNIGILSTTICL